MAFGKHRDTGDVHEPADDVTAGNDVDDVDELDGPFDIDDFDDPSAATLGRLDLGSVLIPMPEAGQVQVELSEQGVPSAVWVVTPNGRFTIAAYAAPKTAGLWRDVATELADSLRKDVAEGQHRGRPVGARGGRCPKAEQDQLAGVVRFIGVDGYRWMIRCVVNGPQDKVEALADEARNALADTVVRRGETPLPVRTPLPVQLPEPMAAQLRAAAEQAAQQQAQQALAGSATAAAAPACRTPQRAWVRHAAAADHHGRLAISAR